MVIHYKLLIPIDLCVTIIKEKLWRPFQVLIYLKFKFGAYAKDLKKNLDPICLELEVSERTVTRAIRILVKLNWIGFDPLTNTTYIRGIDRIRKIEKIYNRQAVWMFPSQIMKFKEFVIAAVLKRQQMELRKREWKLRQERGRRDQNLPLPIFYPISSSYFSNKYGIGLTSAYNYKILANKAGLIKIITNDEPLILNDEKVPCDQIKELREIYREDGIHIKCKKGFIQIQNPFLVKSILSIKKRRSIKGFNLPCNPS